MALLNMTMMNIFTDDNNNEDDNPNNEDDDDDDDKNEADAKPSQAMSRTFHAMHKLAMSYNPYAMDYIDRHHPSKDNDSDDATTQ